jgi:signal transduction histidine kinase/CheY-like chemotaxis protein
MHRFRRAPFMIAAAVILPLLIFLGIVFAFQARNERAAVEAESLEKTKRVLVEADGALQRTLGVLDAVAVSRPMDEAELRERYDRLRQVLRSEPAWVTVRVTDVPSGQALFDLRQPFGSRVTGGGFDPPPRTSRSTRAFVGNMGGSGPGCPCALVHRFIGQGPTPEFLITVAIDSRPFLRMVTAATQPGQVFGLVDRNGNFVARSFNHWQRVGTPATHYVQDAMRRAPSGIYLSRTWEGFESYTAYSTSDLSGWSAHMAFRTRLIDSPRWQALGGALFAALASLVLALAMIWYVLRDLAEGRRVQERLQEAQKMEALGRITGGIAHDFNNLLTPIVGGLGMVSRRAQLDSSSHRLVESALSAARRAAKLTGQLLAFSRRQKMQIVPIDLAALFAEIGPLLEQSAGPGISLNVDLAEDARGVASDPNQLELALLNLVLNARDAMPQGGAISIVTRHHPAGRRQQASVDLQVRDTGEGMDRAVLRRATEPFFTTKGSSGGTGLGLAQVYGIVSQSGGTIGIESERGLGTTVTLTLPAAEVPATASPPADDHAATPEVAAGANILVCDDDDAVRAFVAGVLEEAGYVVASVSDGTGAVSQVRKDAVNLLVVDYAMHGMNGADVVAAVRAFRPDLPVLMITGYADTDTVADLAPGIPVLHKPFESEDLLAAVAEALGAGSNGGGTG